MARQLLDAAGREMRKHFNLTKWTKHEVIRRIYYRRISWALNEFGQEGIEAPDEAVLSLITVGLIHDDSFVSHVLAKGDTSLDLDQVRDCCSRVLYEEYMRAVDKGSWPEE